MSSQSYYAHGKLLLTGEYAVLDGAKALAIPCQFGQKMTISTLENSPFQIEWRGYDVEDELWINAALPYQQEVSPEIVRLQQILKAVESLNPELFYQRNFNIQTFLEFPNNWGLGTSSTLISLLSQWAEVNPFELLDKTFGGSGYDIACATAETPIVYQRNGNQTKWLDVGLSESWTNNAYFIFLEEKKNSRDAIKHYKSIDNTESVVDQINNITDNLVETRKVEDAIALLEAHEECMSAILQIPSINKSRFSDFNGVCKSLGGWGGDFIMAVSNEEDSYIKEYFKNKGLHTVLTFNEMIWT